VIPSIFMICQGLRLADVHQKPAELSQPEVMNNDWNIVMV